MEQRTEGSVQQQTSNYAKTFQESNNQRQFFVSEIFQKPKQNRQRLFLQYEKTGRIL